MLTMYLTAEKILYLESVVVPWATSLYNTHRLVKRSTKRLVIITGMYKVFLLQVLVTMITKLLPTWSGQMKTKENGWAHALFPLLGCGGSWLGLVCVFFSFVQACFSQAGRTNFLRKRSFPFCGLSEVLGN